VEWNGKCEGGNNIQRRHVWAKDTATQTNNIWKPNCSMLTPRLEPVLSSRVLLAWFHGFKCIASRCSWLGSRPGAQTDTTRARRAPAVKSGHDNSKWNSQWARVCTFSSAVLPSKKCTQAFTIRHDSIRPFKAKWPRGATPPPPPPPHRSTRRGFRNRTEFNLLVQKNSLARAGWCERC